MKKTIVEKKLGISPDYQYRQLRTRNFLFSNWHNNKLVVLTKILQMTKAQDVLDLGTGSGNFELKFAKKLRGITGFDYNDEAIKFLKSKLHERNITNVKLVVGDLREIEKAKIPQKFDLIIMTDVIEHIKVVDGSKLIFKLKSMLKKNGKICIITPNYKSAWLFLEWLLDILKVLPHFDGEQHLAKFYKQNLKIMFEKSGFKSLFFSTFNLFSYLFFTKKISAKLCKLEIWLKMPFGNLIVYLFELR